MATYVQHRFSQPASLTRRIQPARVAAPATQPKSVPSTPDVQAPQHYPSDMAAFESARMSRELGREMPHALRRQKPSLMNALMNMSNQRFMVLLAGVALLVLGLLALRFPVFLPDFDQWGVQINCGSGFGSALTQASAASATGANYVDQCHTAIAVRRDWTIPVTLVGVLMLGWLMARAPRRKSA
jgi:hypothetical protein